MKERKKITKMSHSVCCMLSIWNNVHNKFIVRSNHSTFHVTSGKRKRVSSLIVNWIVLQLLLFSHRWISIPSFLWYVLFLAFASLDYVTALSFLSLVRNSSMCFVLRKCILSIFHWMKQDSTSTNNNCERSIQTN